MTTSPLATTPSTTTLDPVTKVCQEAKLKSLAHRNFSLPTTLGSSYNSSRRSSYPDLYSYGVPTNRKILTVELYIHRFDEIRHYLANNIGLTLAEREGILRLLRIYAYYGRVYPKASQIADDFGNMIKGCSRRSFWRAIAKLRDGGMIRVCNRYLHGRQISNCYRLDKLILCLVRCLLERGKRYLNLLALAKEHFDALHIAGFWRVVPDAEVDLCKAEPIRQPGWGGN